MIRRFLRAFPKYFIALAIIVGSVTTLVVWKMRRSMFGGFGALLAPGKSDRKSVV